MSAAGPLPVALVTGASSGLGRACALALGATHEVWLTYHRGRDAGEDVAASIVARGGQARALHLDASVPGSIAALERAFVDGMREAGRRPRLDALVANAGFFGDGYRLLLEIDEDEWDRVWATNTSGVIRLVRTFLERLLPGGTIVNLSTMSVPVGALSYKSHAHYTTSKAATEGFIEAIAAAHAARGLRCVNLVPGLFDTRMLHDELGDELPSWVARIPLGRVGRPEELAAIVARLVAPSPLAVDRIVADGGWLRAGWARV